LHREHGEPVRPTIAIAIAVAVVLIRTRRTRQRRALPGHLGRTRARRAPALAGKRRSSERTEAEIFRRRTSGWAVTASSRSCSAC